MSVTERQGQGVRFCSARGAAALLLAGATAAANANDPPTFARDIAPILYRHCAECHRPEGIGPFSLLTYEDVRRRAATIAEVTASRYMPPWKPEPGYGPALRGERRLADDDLARIQAWVDVGAPAGDLSAAPAPPTFPDDWQLGPPDLIVELPEPYVLAAEGGDVFRNVVIPVPLDRPRYVRAVEFKPGTALAVHHANLGLDASGDARRRDAAEPGPGWSSMDLGDAANPRGHLVGWTPGQSPYEAHPGTAWRLAPGTDLVVQLHLLPTGRPTPVRPQVGLYFAEGPPTRESVVLLLREHDIDIPAGAADHRIEESLVLPAPARLLGLYPHAHYLGRDLRVFAEPPGGGRLGLLRIPDWDFNWQGDYRFRDPPRLPAGTRIVMEYSYDNSAANPRNPSNPPRRVRAGWNSSDEMGEVALQFLLDDPGQLPDFELTQARYDLAGRGRTPETLYALAGALHQAGRHDEAAATYRDVLTLDPSHPKALNNLAVLRIEAGDDAEARSLLDRLLSLDPAAVSACLNLGLLHRRSGEQVSAARAFEDVLRRQPDDVTARRELAGLWQETGSPAAALDLLREGLRWHRTNAAYLVELGRLEARSGQRDAARQRFAAATAVEDATAADRADAWFSLAVLAQADGDLAAIDRALAEALRLDPGHTQVLLMSAASALVQRAHARALEPLRTLLGLPAEARPGTDAMVALLPAPDGRIALAEAMVDTGAAAAARDLLQPALDDARQAGREDLLVRIEALRRRLHSPP
jgi:tetratricopeptide (TPR) repeat protein/mono/diheme cytochrome c family protein